MDKRYWLQTEYNDGDKWALHEVVEDNDNVVLWKNYKDTPNYPEDKEDIDGGWKAIDEYIKKELGFLPEYEVN